MKIFCYRIPSYYVLPTLLWENCQGTLRWLFFSISAKLESRKKFKNTTNVFFVLSFSRMPQLFTKDIALVQQFFESMCKVSVLKVILSLSVQKFANNENHSRFILYQSFCSRISKTVDCSFYCPGAHILHAENWQRMQNSYLSTCLHLCD